MTLQVRDRYKVMEPRTVNLTAHRRGAAAGWHGGVMPQHEQLRILGCRRPAGRDQRPQRRMKIRCTRRTDINGYHAPPLMLAFAAARRERGLLASRTPAEGR